GLQQREGDDQQHQQDREVPHGEDLRRPGLQALSAGSVHHCPTMAGARSAPAASAVSRGIDSSSRDSSAVTPPRSKISARWQMPATSSKSDDTSSTASPSSSAAWSSW